MSRMEMPSMGHQPKPTREQKGAMGSEAVPLKQEGIPISHEVQKHRVTGEKEADAVFENALKHLGDFGLEINPTFVANAKAMAKFSGIKEEELSQEILDLYAILRDESVSLDENKNPTTKYFVTMGDQKLFAEVLYLLGDDPNFHKLMEAYPNIFHQETIAGE